MAFTANRNYVLQRVRFTSEATIYKINTVEPWYYKFFLTCGQKVTLEVAAPIKMQHMLRENQAMVGKGGAERLFFFMTIRNLGLLRC
nr:hypothetical protein [Tanacetum cinerariifolium]